MTSRAKDPEQSAVISRTEVSEQPPVTSESEVSEQPTMTEDTPQKPFRFFDLPGELRNQIYSYLNLTCGITMYGYQTLSIAPVSMFPNHERGPYGEACVENECDLRRASALWWTCRQLRMEAISFVWSRQTVYAGGNNLNKLIKMNHPAESWIKRVDLQLFDLHSENCSWWRHAQRVDYMSFDGHPCVKVFAEHQRNGRFPGLQWLRFGITDIMSCADGKCEAITKNTPSKLSSETLIEETLLGCLTQMKGLRYFYFEICWWRPGDHLHWTRLVADVERRIRTEVTQGRVSEAAQSRVLDLGR